MKKKVRSKERVKMLEVQNFIIYNCEKQLTAKGLAKRFNMNEEELKSEFKKWSYKSLPNFLTYTRITQGRIKLEHTDLSIRNIAAKVGYINSGAFSQAFKRLYEVSPTEYRKRYQEKQAAINAGPAKQKKRKYAY